MLLTVGQFESVEPLSYASCQMFKLCLGTKTDAEEIWVIEGEIHFSFKFCVTVVS